jgi:hypothetical protein
MIYYTGLTLLPLGLVESMRPSNAEYSTKVLFSVIQMRFEDDLAKFIYLFGRISGQGTVSVPHRQHERDM